MDSQTPVTLLMPIRNGITFLPASQRSILENARAFDEIIIVDDGSTDGSYDFCHLWALRDPRVRLIRNQGGSLVSALNLGIAESTNDYIARFDVDDTYLPTRVEKQIASINANEVAIFSDYEMLDKDSQYLSIFPSAIFPHAVSVSLIKSQRTAHPSVLFNKEAVLAVGGYQEADYLVEDLSLWLRLTHVGELASVPEVLLKYRFNPDGVTGRNRAVMFSQRESLISRVGIRKLDLEKSLAELDKTIEKYNSFNCSQMRILLHLMDLKSAMEVNGKSMSSFHLKFLSSLLSYSNCKAGAQLIRERRNRNKMRHSLA
jgi:glycosyltransferase involved in cell wall biosynthesis